MTDPAFPDLPVDPSPDLQPRPKLPLPLIFYFVFIFVAVLVLIGFRIGLAELQTVLPTYLVSRRPLIAGKTVSPSPVPKPTPAFDIYSLPLIAPLMGGDGIYYLQNGTLTHTSYITTPSRRKTETALAIGNKMLTFALSDDRKLLAYSVSTGRREEPGWSGARGDEIYIQNILTDAGYRLYATSSAEEMEIRSMEFSPDGQSLYFTSNSLWIADLATKKVTGYLSQSAGSFCGLYFINDISPDGKKLLIRQGCYEGSRQLVFDIPTHQTLGTFDNGYIEGGVTGLGFLDNGHLLGFENTQSEAASSSSPAYHVYVYDLSAKRTDTGPAFVESFGTVSSVYNTNHALYFKGYPKSGNPQTAVTKVYRAYPPRISPLAPSEYFVGVNETYAKSSDLWVVDSTLSGILVKLNSEMDSGSPVVTY